MYVSALCAERQLKNALVAVVFPLETDVGTAQHAWEKSCYFNIDYKVDENETVYDAVRRMAAYNVGCLIVTTNGRVSFYQWY